MKMKVTLVMALLLAAGRAMAAVEDCPAPAENDPYTIPVDGAIDVPLPAGCKGVVVNSPLGPIKNFDVVNTTVVVSGTAVATPTTAPSDLPDGMEVIGQPEDSAPQNDMNAQQLRRLGELDAMQGRPLNMTHANDLGYLQGYTDGQMMRQRGGYGGFGR